MANAQEPILLSTSCILNTPEPDGIQPLNSSRQKLMEESDRCDLSCCRTVVLKWTLQRGKKNPTHLGNLVVSYLALGSISVVTDFYFGPLELPLQLF